MFFCKKNVLQILQKKHFANKIRKKMVFAKKVAIFFCKFAKLQVFKKGAILQLRKFAQVAQRCPKHQQQIFT